MRARSVGGQDKRRRGIQYVPPLAEEKRREQWAEMLSRIRTGDLILVTSTRSVVSWLIRWVTESHWSHAALYVGRRQILSDKTVTVTRCGTEAELPPGEDVIQEAVSTGVGIRSLEHYNEPQYRLLVLRLEGFEPSQYGRLLTVLWSQLGRPYSYRCSLVTGLWCLLGKVLGVELRQLFAKTTSEFITPGDLAQSSKLIQVCFVNIDAPVSEPTRRLRPLPQSLSEALAPLLLPSGAGPQPQAAATATHKESANSNSQQQDHFSFYQDLQPGDVILYSLRSGVRAWDRWMRSWLRPLESRRGPPHITHMAIYLGGGMVVDDSLKYGIARVPLNLWRKRIEPIFVRRPSDGLGDFVCKVALAAQRTVGFREYMLRVLAGYRKSGN